MLRRIFTFFKKRTLKSFIDNKATKGPAMYFNGCTLTVLLDFAVQCRRTLMVDPTRSDDGGLRYSVKSVHFCPRKRPLPPATPSNDLSAGAEEEERGLPPRRKREREKEGLSHLPPPVSMALFSCAHFSCTAFAAGGTDVHHFHDVPLV